MKMYRNSLNLYNSAETEWINAIKDDSGVESASSVSHYTANYTAVLPETNYCLAGSKGESGQAHRIYYYDENKEWISRSAGLAYNVSIFTTPANCRFVQFQVNRPITGDDWMLTEGDTEQAFEPYNVVDWYGYTYKLRASGAWTDGSEKKRSGGAWT